MQSSAEWKCSGPILSCETRPFNRTLGLPAWRAATHWAIGDLTRKLARPPAAPEPQ